MIFLFTLYILLMIIICSKFSRQAEVASRVILHVEKHLPLTNDMNQLIFGRRTLEVCTMFSSLVDWSPPSNYNRLLTSFEDTLLSTSLCECLWELSIVIAICFGNQTQLLTRSLISYITKMSWQSTFLFMMPCLSNLYPQSLNLFMSSV